MGVVMMNRFVCVSLALSIGGFVVTGCKDRQACEEARLRMSRTWEEVKKTAAVRKVPASYEVLSEKEKADREAKWRPIEIEAETLRSSFETPQVTWDAAERSRGVIQAKYSEIPSAGNPLIEGFGRQLSSANVQYEELKANCK
jgi:hypothetical protein